MFNVLGIAIFSFFAVAPAYAERVVGNGGHGIACERTRQVESLDAYEAREFGPLQLGSPALSVEEKLEIAFERIGRLSPSAVVNLSTRYAHFKKMTKFVTSDIPYTNDQGAFSLPSDKKCKLVQVAAQVWSPYPGERAYRINQALWERMDGDDKVALILHELYFGVLLQSRCNCDSKPVRTFLGAVLNGRMDDFSHSDFHLFTQRVFRGFKKSLEIPAIFAAPVSSARVTWNTTLGVLDKEPAEFPVSVNNKIVPMMLKDGSAEFFVFENDQIAVSKFDAKVTNGVIEVSGQKFRIKSGNDYELQKFDLETPSTITVDGKEYSMVQSVALYPKSDVPSYIEGDELASWRVLTPGKINVLFSSKRIDFYKSGRIHKATLKHTSKLKTGSGRAIEFLGGRQVEFFESGFVRKGKLAYNTVFVPPETPFLVESVADGVTVTFSEKGELLETGD